MAKFKVNTLTVSAQALINRALAGLSEVQFTRMAFGDGIHNSSTLLPTATGLKNERNSVSISSLTVKDDKSVCVEGILSNEELTESDGYKITEIGLFARNRRGESNSEFLYAIAVADEEFADYLPGYDGYAPVKILQNFYVAVADSSSTTIAVDSNVTASKVYVDKEVSTLRDEISRVDNFYFDFKNQMERHALQVNSSWKYYNEIYSYATPPKFLGAEVNETSITLYSFTDAMGILCVFKYDESQSLADAELFRTTQILFIREKIYRRDGQQPSASEKIDWETVSWKEIV